jgi:O-antigen/teichoic acid export membrane protein
MLQGIAQPVFAKTDEDKERQRNIFRKLLRFTAFVSFPLLLGLALVAKEFIVILLGEKWLESARLLQLLCVMGAFYPVSNLFTHLLISRGHSATYMWGNIVLCLVQLLAVVFSAPYGIEAMLMVFVAITIAWTLVWHGFVHREIGLRLWDVIRDISPYLLITVVLIYIAHLLTVGLDSLYVRFLVKVAFVAVTYCLTLWLLKSTIFHESYRFIFRKDIS